MNRRWQADGISFWRKLSSSNWWWYGEVNPTPASLPSPENRPKFWRGDAVAWTIMIFGVPTLFFVSEEINSRHWPFSHTTTYVERIVATNYRHPQLEVELEDKTVVSMAFPMQDGFGVWNINQPISQWISFVKKLKTHQFKCPSQLLSIDAEPRKFTLKPLLNIWGVSCANGELLIDQEDIVQVWRSHHRWATAWSFGFGVFFFFLILVGIIRRERKLYVKS